MRRRRLVENAHRAVVTDYPGDPAGEQLAGALAHRLGRQLSGASGTIYAHANGSPQNSFAGYARGGLRVGLAANPVQYRNASATKLHTAVSDEMDPYKSILAARLARGQQ